MKKTILSVTCFILFALLLPGTQTLAEDYKLWFRNGNDPFAINDTKFHFPRFYDLNGDGIKEVIISHGWEVIGTNYLYQYPAQHPEDTQVDVYQILAEPRANGIPALKLSGTLSYLPGFARGAASFTDMDGDGDPDMVCGAYTSGLYWFKNVGNVNNPNYSIVTQKVCNTANAPIKPGAYLKPSFVDLDNDGDLDMVLGIAGIGLKCYERVNNSPTGWQLNANFFSQINFAQVSTAKKSSVSCDFADLDGDGDKDMVIGWGDGTIEYYRNDGLSGGVITWGSQGSLLDVENKAIDVGDMAAPCFVDIDNDGDFDLIVGTKLKGGYCFENVGSSVNARWQLREGNNSPLFYIEPQSPAAAEEFNPAENIQIDLGLNEYEAFEIFFTPDGNLGNVDMSISGYANCKTLVFDDYKLKEAAVLSPIAGITSRIWLIFDSFNMAPGNYSAQLTFTPAIGPQKTLHFNIKIWDVAQTPVFGNEVGHHYDMIELASWGMGLGANAAGWMSVNDDNRQEVVNAFEAWVDIVAEIGAGNNYASIFRDAFFSTRTKIFGDLVRIKENGALWKDAVNINNPQYHQLFTNGVIPELDFSGWDPFIHIYLEKGIKTFLFIEPMGMSGFKDYVADPILTQTGQNPSTNWSDQACLNVFRNLNGQWARYLKEKGFTKVIYIGHTDVDSGADPKFMDKYQAFSKILSDLGIITYFVNLNTGTGVYKNIYPGTVPGSLPAYLLGHPTDHTDEYNYSGFQLVNNTTRIWRNSGWFSLDNLRRAILEGSIIPHPDLEISAPWAAGRKGGAWQDYMFRTFYEGLRGGFWHAAMNDLDSFDIDDSHILGRYMDKTIFDLNEVDNSNHYLPLYPSPAYYAARDGNEDWNYITQLMRLRERLNKMINDGSAPAGYVSVAGHVSIELNKLWKESGTDPYEFLTHPENWTPSETNDVFKWRYSTRICGYAPKWLGITAVSTTNMRYAKAKVLELIDHLKRNAPLILQNKITVAWGKLPLVEEGVAKIVIVTGNGVSQEDIAKAHELKSRIEELGATMVAVKKESELTDMDNQLFSIIIIGEPASINMIEDLRAACPCNPLDPTVQGLRVTASYPGLNSYLINTMPSIWNSANKIITIIGSDEVGTRRGVDNFSKALILPRLDHPYVPKSERRDVMALTDDLSFTPAPAIGTETSIGIIVRNIGNVDESVTINFLVDGRVIDTKTVTVSKNSTATVSTQWTPLVDKVYNISVKIDVPGLPASDNDIVSGLLFEREPGLVGYWRFNEGGGTNVLDESGWLNDGILVGGTAHATGLRGTGAVSFDGTNDYIDFGNKATWDLAGSAHTFSVWFKTTDNGYVTLFDRYIGGSPGAGYALTMNAGKLKFSACADGGDNIWIQTSRTYNDNVWHHAAVVVDVTNKRGYLYVDGNLVYSDAYLGNLINRSENLKVGSMAWSDYDFAGLIDEFKIYQRALTSDEIKAMSPLNNWLIGEWLCDGTNGVSLADTSGFGNAGVMTGDTAHATGLRGTGAVSFDGMDDYIDFGNKAIWDLAETDHTFSVWFKTTDNGNATLFDRYIGGSPGAGYALTMNAGKLKFSACADGGDNIWIQTSRTYNDNVWHHAAVVVDVTNKRGYLYVDGNLVYSDAYLGNLINRSENLKVGSMAWGDYDFAGLIDEFKIYQRALTSDEVNAMSDW